jgi:hypothetical protein
MSNGSPFLFRIHTGNSQEGLTVFYIHLCIKTDNQYILMENLFQIMKT